MAEESGSDFWGKLDRVVDGLSSTGSSILDGAGNFADKYHTYFGGGQDTTESRPETVVDKSAELNTSASTTPVWLQNPLTWALAGLALLGIGLIAVGAAKS